MACKRRKSCLYHDDIIKWKHLPLYWPFVRRIHRSLVNYPHKGQWHEADMFSLICTWINGGVNNRESGDLRRHRVHYDVTVTIKPVAEKKNLIRSSYALNYNHCILIYSPSISYHRFRSHVGASSQQNLQKLHSRKPNKIQFRGWIIPLITVGICRQHK